MSEKKGNGSWTIRYKGKLIVRDYGVLLYNGPEADAPQNILDIANEMMVSWKDVLLEMNRDEQKPS